jgi:hypothetical protein
MGTHLRKCGIRITQKAGQIDVRNWRIVHMQTLKEEGAFKQ